MRSPKAQRRRSYIASNYSDDHSLAASTIKTYDYYSSHVTAVAQGEGFSNSDNVGSGDDSDSNDDDSVATNRQDNTNYYPPQQVVTSEMDTNDDLSSVPDVSVATPRRHNKERSNGSATSNQDTSRPTTPASVEGNGEAADAAAECDVADMEVPTSPSIVTLGSIATTATMAKDDAHMADVSVEMPPSLHRPDVAAGSDEFAEAQRPMKVEGLVGDDGQAFVPTAHSVAGSKDTKQTKSTTASTFVSAPRRSSNGDESSNWTPSLNSKGTANVSKTDATQPTVSDQSSETSYNGLRISGSGLSGGNFAGASTSKHVQSSGSVATKATRTTKASEAAGSSRSRVTASTRRTALTAATTTTVKSFHSLAGRGGRKALRAAKLANIRPDMAMPSMPKAPSSSSVYKAAGDDMTLKTVDGGATVRTSFTRRSTKSAVTTATARSFYSLSARSGRKAVTAARLASKADITSPLALPPNPRRSDKSSKMAIDDNATANMFDEYFPMDGGDNDYDEEEGSPRGCLIVCCADDSFNADMHHEDKIIDTEDILDEGAWDNYEWHELPSHVRDAACLLGCTSSKAWDCGGVAYNNDKSWNELSSAQIRAARVLGFNQRLWDHEAIERTRFHEAVRGLDTYREVVECNKETGMITSIALPATWENMIELITGAIQVALISQYLGPEVLAAYAVVESCLSIAYNIGSGLADAEEILVCQALGMEDTFLAGQYTLLSIATYLLAAAPVYIILIFFIDEIIIGLRLGNEIANIAMLYIPVLTLSHLIHDTFANTLSSLLRCSGKNLQMAIIDSIFNVLHMALVAVAIVSLDFNLVEIAWIEVVIAMTYGVFIFAYSSAKGWLQPFLGGLTDVRVLLSLKSIKNMMALTIPLAWGEFLDSAEWSVISMFAGWMGEVELNAWTILGSLWGIFEYAPEGIHTAVVMRLAFHLGHGDPRTAKVTGYKCLAYSGTLSLLISVVFFAWHKEIIALFTYNANITNVLQKNSLLIAVGNVILSLGGTAGVILTAQGRPATTTWIYSIGVWGMSVPLSAWFTFGLEYNTSGLVCAMLIAYTTSSLALLFCVFTTNWAKASMETIAAEADEDGSFDGDDSSTIAPHYSVVQGGNYGDDLSTAKSPSRRSHRSSSFAPSTGMLEGQEDNDHRTLESPTPKNEPRTEQRADATTTSKHLASFAASPLDDILECDEEDNLSAYGMETTMSPSGNFTIVENRDARFRQWVGARPSKVKKGKKRPPRAPKKGSGSRRTGESHSPNIEK